MTEVVRDTHKSADFIALLQTLDAAYAPDQVLRFIMDSHSVHISMETRAI